MRPRHQREHSVLLCGAEGQSIMVSPTNSIAFASRAAHSLSGHTLCDTVCLQQCSATRQVDAMWLTKESPHNAARATWWPTRDKDSDWQRTASDTLVRKQPAWARLTNWKKKWQKMLESNFTRHRIDRSNAVGHSAQLAKNCDVRIRTAPIMILKPKYVTWISFFSLFFSLLCLWSLQT